MSIVRIEDLLGTIPLVPGPVHFFITQPDHGPVYVHTCTWMSAYVCACVICTKVCTHRQVCIGMCTHAHIHIYLIT